jgi:hypothetical protein
MFWRRKTMTNLIIFGAVGAFLIAVSLILLTGRGSFLLAGYNTMPKEKKAQYDAKALCKFVGKILLPIGVLTPFVGIDSVTSWLVWVWIAIISVLLIFAVVYANTGNRFRK